MAKELIRENKGKNLNVLIQSLTRSIAKALETKNFLKIQKLKKKHPFLFQRNISFNKLEGLSKSLPGFNLADQSLQKLFALNFNKAPHYIRTFKEEDKTIILRVLPFVPPPSKKKQEKENLQKEDEEISQALALKLRQNIFVNYQERFPVKIFSNRIGQDY